MAEPIADDNPAEDEEDGVEEEEVDVGGRNALVADPPTVGLLRWLWLLLLVLWVIGVIDVFVDEPMVATEGPHCSMARNRSRSQRRKTSSNTERFRCGNSWTSMSIALGETTEWLSAASIPNHFKILMKTCNLILNTTLFKDVINLVF